MRWRVFWGSAVKWVSDTLITGLYVCVQKREEHMARWNWVIRTSGMCGMSSSVCVDGNRAQHEHRTPVFCQTHQWQRQRNRKFTVLTTFILINYCYNLSVLLMLENWHLWPVCIFMMSTEILKAYWTLIYLILFSANALKIFVAVL